MKRIILLLLMLLFVLPNVWVSAEIEFSESEVEDDYMAIRRYYEKAIASPAYAKESLEALITYYTRTRECASALDQYADALRYYHYAKARLCIYKEEYAEACDHFRTCGAFGENRDAYLSFAEGMYYKQLGQYAAAIDKLEDAQSLTDLSATVTMQLGDCYTQYAVQIKTKAAELCAAGDHKSAQDHYTILMLELGQSEGQTLLNNCIAHSSIDKKKENLQILSVSPMNTNEIELHWQGTAASYTVWISFDLMNAEIPDILPLTGTIENQNAACVRHSESTGSFCSWIVNFDSPQKDYYATISNLLPGTTYSVHVVSNSDPTISEQRSCTTVAAQAMENTCAISETIWRYDQRAYTSSINSTSVGSSVFSMMKTRNKVFRCNDNVVDLSSNSLRNQGIYLNVTTDCSEVKAELDGKTALVLLHVENVGTTLEEYVLFSEQAELYGSNKISFILDSLFESSMKTYGSLSGKEFSITILIDGLMLHSVSGMVK